MAYWKKIWTEMIFVPIEELAECHYSFGKHYIEVATNTEHILTKERILEFWYRLGDKLDAFILPHAGGHHTIGIRYGNGHNEFISPYGNKKKVQALLDKYKDNGLNKKHIVVAHVHQGRGFTREDGMEMLLIDNSYWVIRAPGRGQTRFWNGEAWILSSLIAKKLPGWPNEFRFMKDEAIRLLETLQYND